MVSERDRASGEGLLGLDTPEEWDAPFERGEARFGTALIGLMLRCSATIRTRDSKNPHGLRLAVAPTVWADFVTFASGN
ncbi:DUF397 domain-containing protein [Streptomyces sp. NPDC005813]|uniref:DUF397 domain-containing protein n=1 Tax=Streptomyces sp. NPDC005813 TaxID=3155592 RepID=UPI003408A7A1